MTKIIATLPFVLAGLVAAVAAPGISSANTESHWLHKDYAFGPYGVAGITFYLDHSWAESTGDSGCTNDKLQSKGKTSGESVLCNTTGSGNSACASKRLYVRAQKQYNQSISCGNVSPWFTSCYAHSNDGQYLWNVVCHQATNRAFAHSPVPWLYYILNSNGSTWFAGATQSQQLFGYYGADAPGVGARWGAGC